MCHRLDIRPVERDCICPQRDPDGPHGADCNGAFRAKFFGTVQDVRGAFAADVAQRHAIEAVAAASILN